MSAFSDYLENELLDHILRNSAWTPPATVYIALFTASTGLEANTPSAEVSGGSYARESATFDVAASGTTSNSGVISFTPATANWGTITHAAIMDASTAGNVLFWAALTASKTINTGDTFEYSAGAFDVTLA